MTKTLGSFEAKKVLWAFMATSVIYVVYAFDQYASIDKRVVVTETKIEQLAQKTDIVRLEGKIDNLAVLLEKIK